MDPDLRPYDPVAEEAEVRKRFPDQDGLRCGVCNSSFGETKPRTWDAGCTTHNSAVCQPCYRNWLGSNVVSGRFHCAYGQSCQHGLRPAMLAYLIETMSNDSPLKKFDFPAWFEKLSIDAIGRLISCPNCHRQSDGDSYCESAECPYCDARFCTFCRDLTDSDRPHRCTLFEWMVEMRGKSGYRAPEHADRSGKLKKYLDAGDVGNYYHQSFKVGLCPHCRAISQKVDGCSYVTCLTCKKGFDWSKAIDPVALVTKEKRKKAVQRLAEEKAAQEAARKAEREAIEAKREATKAERERLPRMRKKEGAKKAEREAAKQSMTEVAKKAERKAIRRAQRAANAVRRKADRRMVQRGR